MTLWQVVAGRIIAGFGGGGMIALVLVLIAGEEEVCSRVISDLTGSRPSTCTPSRNMESLFQRFLGHRPLRWWARWRCPSGHNRMAMVGAE